MDTDKKKQMIKLCIAISLVIIVIIVVIAIMIKYEVEGDKNMPFNLSKIMIVSTAEGVETEGNNKWNFNVFQNNDLYFYLDKNEKYVGKESVINSVIIENIQILENPKVGNIKIYMPNSTTGRLYSYDKEYLVEDKLEYKGANKSDSRTLEIGSQGGNALIRFTNADLGTYSSNDETEIIHDGTLVKKLNLLEQDINFKVSFDLIMKVSNCTYSTNIIMDFPYGNLLEEGTVSKEKVDMSDIIFKRVK